MTLTLREKLGYAVNAFNSIGIGREAALGALGSIAGESGKGFDTQAFNPNDPNGGSIGIGQWHSERRTALEKFAETSKYGLNDFRTQVDFIVHELQTTHKQVKNALVGPNVTRAKAVKIWTQKYEIPAKKYEHLEKRKTYANQFAAEMAGVPVDSATPEELSRIEAAVESLTGQPVSLGYVDFPDLTGDVSLTGAELSGQKKQSKYPATPESGPVPGNRPGPVPPSKPGTAAETQVASAPQSDFDYGRFGPETGTIPPDQFDWGRMSVTPNAPTVAVAEMNAPALEKSTAVPGGATSLAAFDMERFGPAVPATTAPTQTAAASPTSPLGAAGYGPDVFDVGRFGPSPAVDAINAQFAASPSPLANAAAAAPAASAYVDPMVTKDYAPGGKKSFATNPAAATTSTSTGPQSVGEAVTGLGNAIEGMFGDLSAAGKALKQGDITGTFKALPGGPTAPTSQQAAAEAETKAQAQKGPVQSFLDADTTFGGFAGAMLGGYFGGPLGAIAGGLIGQGINNAVNKNAVAKAATVEQAEANGMNGGIGRAIDSLIGGINSMFGNNTQRSGDLSKDYFPEAPSPPANSDGSSGNFSAADRAGAKQWGKDNPNASPGLW